jgi:GxxExxY protein
MTQIGRPKDLRDEQTYTIIGAAMEAHRILGHRFLEPVYQAALARELTERGVGFRREVDLPICYKGLDLDVRYRADFVCYNSILVEVKALERLTDKEGSQVINYLAASRLGRGILLNFGASSLQVRRFVGPTYATAQTPSV